MTDGLRLFRDIFGFAREHVLDALKSRQITFIDPKGATPKVDRAKTQAQKSRNKWLRKVCDY